ncbi:MAG: hypothetical protein ACJ8J7_12210 [Sulfurifustaceae bacterium]
MRHLIVLFAVLLVAPALAATKTYQVTGPVVDVSDDAIVVEKGKEKWEIARDPSTKVKGDANTVKKGDRVTVEYRMSATSIEVKGGQKAASKEKSADKSKGAAAPAK